MNRTILGGVAIAALATLTTFGGQSAEERRGQELRQALRQIVDEIEALKQEEIALLGERIQVLEVTLKARSGSGDPKDFDFAKYVLGLNSRMKRDKRTLETAEAQLPKKLAELRQDVEKYTDAELPMLDFGLRWEKTEAESAVEHAKETLEWDQQKQPSKMVSLEAPAPPPTPAWPLAEIREGLSKRIDEIEQIHQMVIAKLQARQEAEVNQQRKREIGDLVVVTQARGRHDILFLRGRLSRARGYDLGRVERSIASGERQAEGRLAEGLREILEVGKKAGPQ